MNPTGHSNDPLLSDAGQWMYRFIEELYPICRSITGEGTRETLRRIARYAPIEIHEVPTGTKAFDWTVPKEWKIRDAYIDNMAGKRVVDFRKSNLHVLNYSTPFRGKVTLETLREHLFTLPDQPDRIPYRTSYYKENWGFCVSQRQAEALQDPEYEVCIDADLKDGSLTYGECLVQGSTDHEVLLSCHICHPSLCNDNLSGIALTTWLAKHLQFEENQIFVSLPVHPRDDRRHRLVKPKRKHYFEDPSRPGGRLRRRFRKTHLQEKPAGRCRDRPGRSPRAPDEGIGLFSAGVLALRIRRATILLPGVRSPGGITDAHAAWRLSGVSHIRRTI